MGSSVSALPNGRGQLACAARLLDADISVTRVTWRDSPEVRSAPFPFKSAARTDEQHRHSQVLDDKLTTLLGYTLQAMRNITRNG